MNWEAIGATAELLGAIAVVATLAYLAVQIRQTNEISRTQAYHLAIEQLVAGAMRPEFGLLLESEHRELTEEEKLTLVFPLTAVLYSHEIVYYLWKKGQIDDALWRNLWVNNKGFLLLEPSMSLMETREGPLSQELLKLLRESAGADA